MNSHNIEKAPTNRCQASLTSVGGTRSVLKRGHSSPASSDEQREKRARTRARETQNRYPGAHVETWHLSSATITEEKSSVGQQLTQGLLSFTSFALGDGFTTTQQAPFVPNHNKWPPYQSAPVQQWFGHSITARFAQEPLSLFPNSPAALDISLSTSDPALPTTSSSIAYENQPEACPEKVFLPEAGVNTMEATPLADATDFVSPTQLEDIGFYRTLLTQSYQDPASFTTGSHFPHMDYLPWAYSNYHTIGGEDLFPISHQGVPSDAVPLSGLEADYNQPSICNGSWHPEQLQLNIMHENLFLNEVEAAAQPLFHNAPSDPTSLYEHFGQDESCLSETCPHEDQINLNSSLVLHPRRDSPKPQPKGADTGKDVLVICEDNQDAAEQCTCKSRSPEARCPSCVNSLQPWITVTFKPATNNVRKQKKRKAREPFKEDARQQTCQTRNVGACIRCKIQRIRCIPNNQDPFGPCVSCSRVAQSSSKKVIHHISCQRYKLQEVVLFRTTASRVTDRWKNAQVQDVVTHGETLSVEMMQDFVVRPFKFDVRKMVEAGRDRYHDKITRDWYDGRSIIQEPVADYALADVHDTMRRYKDYIRDSVLGVGCQPAFEKLVEGFRNSSCGTEVVGEVYQQAWEYFSSLPSEDGTWDFFTQPKGNMRMRQFCRTVPEKAFLLGFFELQFAMRHGTGWSWIVTGGIPGAAAIKEYPPLKGRVSTPRLVVGQIDCIRISDVLKPLSRELLNKVYLSWIADRRYDRWMSIFFVTFILLSEVAKATEDAYHHGWYDKEIRRNGPKNAHIIRDIHESANIILAYWHYYNCSTNVSEVPNYNKKAMNKTPLRALAPEQLVMVQGLWNSIRQWKQRPRDNGPYDNDTTEGWWTQWCHSMYFADQMVDTRWEPRQVFA